MPVTAINRAALAPSQDARAELLAAALRGELPVDAMLETSLRYLEELK
ncbi:hypothetical protein ROA7450_00246 [Roseovarius albus]|uniref:Uncharacterized protein n=1 Tax=Roseovarius albus TaxID=1247867 RepID=A0A1X6Y9C5_9RHOB|nr:hypothetical protein [Roseovarius albus]SLN14068.1 hypothetical protein ROA7450_00246 [Roseovarius albus]